MNYLKVFILLFSINCFSQSFQIELVDINIGTSLTEPPNFFSNESNDQGLNQIFQTHNVIWYEAAYGFLNSLEFDAKINIANCDSCDSQQFIQDLMDYSSVIEYASVNNGNGFYNNALSLNLVDENIGNYEGENNDIVQTSDSGLNQIFTDFSVREYLSNPIEGNYELICSCDAELLKNELEDYSSVIASVNRISMTFLLSEPQFNLKEFIVYPNPFTDRVTIADASFVAEFQLFDILGKQLLNAKDKNIVEVFSSTLHSGVYILRLKDFKGDFTSKKIIKIK